MIDIDVYGWLGWEMEAESHIRIRVIFAVVDRKLTRLAWCMFSQDLVLQRWYRAFDYVALGYEKLDRNEVFGEAIPYPTLNDYAGSDIGKIAPPLLKTMGAPASHFLLIDNRDWTTTCKLQWRDDAHNLVHVQFGLTTAGERRSFNMEKTGRVYLLGVERFSSHALNRGIHRASALTGGLDPYSPIW
jgi:hypothetical protein